MSFEWYYNQPSWALSSGDFSTTYVIALSFVFLAYFLHPVVEASFRRIRAYRGWCEVENRRTVEVTTYPLVKEVCGGRGRWDAARIVAILLAAFSLVSWGLELPLDIASKDGLVTDLFLRPPPVWVTEIDEGVPIWNVISSEELGTETDELMYNMFGSFSDGIANAIYEVNNGSDKIVNGVVEVASWSNSLVGLTTKLSYDEGNGIAHIPSDFCSNNGIVFYMDNEHESWGEVFTCTGGSLDESDASASPALKLAKTEGEMYIIVEGSVTYPSFFYSVWVAKNGDTTNSTEFHHVFHITLSARLAEAVVTETVHASLKCETPTGGGSFALLRKFSELYSTYDAIGWDQRASPFGEHPTGEEPNIQLSRMDTIEEGVMLNTTALLCAVWIMVLTSMGIAWSLLLRSSIGMDVYDRDELIRAVAVTSPASANVEEHSSKMRILVRKEGNGNMSVAVVDVEGHQSSCPQSFRRHETIPIDDPLPVSTPNRDYGFGGAAVSPGRTVWLEGMRTRRARVYPGRESNYRYPTSIALVASPVSSRVGSAAGTPVAPLASPDDARPPNRPLTCIGSRVFERFNSLDESEAHDGDVEMGRTRGQGEPEDDPGEKGGHSRPSPPESRKTELIDPSLLRLDSESRSTLPNGEQAPCRRPVILQDRDG